MSDPNQPMLLTATHLNKGLFSDHYLDKIVREMPIWHDGVLHEEVKKLRDELRDLLASLQPEHLSEAQLEDQWVQPVLEKLGHHWSVQVQIRYRDTGYRKPDYGFTRTVEETRALTKRIYPPAEIAHLLALGDAKAWGMPLDQASNKERNPSQQIDEYLRYSELPWGILTDGRYWRLYHRETSKDNAYYAVDLPALLKGASEREAVENFYYFYLFFRQAAFARDGWLEQVRQGSVSYAEGLSDKLEEEVYEALRLIAEGFLRYRRNRLQADATTLRTIYEQSLVLLYRLLFVLYAESRDVLPMNENGVYAQHRSLRALNKDVFLNIIEGDTDYFRRVDEAGVYTRLNALFFAIDQGDAAYHVTPYNGRLFSEEEHPFLAEKAIGDAYLAPALDRLARVYETAVKGRRPRRVLVDYRDLDVRHLGAIYEKLLEYELAVAETDLTVKGNQYVETKAGETPDVTAGQAYLRTGNNERKITGSYYTPDYIVRFIVERTLEPLLTEITQQQATLDAEGHWVANDREALRQAIMNINVLDPATGSGHFMVEAVGYIAEWLRKLALQPADLGTDEDELAYWKRHAVTACIYGVDVNRLAVELAKLSLWLATIGRGKPLSFLDHHVKPGNTLVGARMGEIGATLTPSPPDPHPLAPSPLRREGEQEQLSLFEEAGFAEAVSKAVMSMSSIEGAYVETVKDVKGQEHTFADLKAATYPLRVLADVWTARHFGMAVDEATWGAVYERLVHDPHPLANVSPPPSPLPASQGGGAGEVTAAAGRLAAAYHFFHWELEFPEVFFDAEGKPLPDGGFDAVIGNPPYVRQERIQPYKPYFEATYEVHQGTADLYVYFYERALTLLKPGGYASYITANKWMRAGYGEPMRGFLSAKAETQQIVDFGHAPIFHDADTFPAIAVVRNPKGERATDATAHITQFPRTSLGKYTLSEYTQQKGYPIPLSRFSSAIWSLEQPETEALIEKIRQTGVPLHEFFGYTPYRGILTGLNEAFLIDTATKEQIVQQDPKSTEIINPYLRGQDIKRWSPEYAGLWMILLKSSENHTWAWSEGGEKAEQVFAETYPSIYKHFEPLRDRLIKREDQGRFWWELRSCTYYDVFHHHKIIHTDITWRPQFAYSNQPIYLSNTAYVWPKADFYTLAVLNSPLMWAYMWRTAQHGKDEALRIIYSYVETLPIAQPTDAIRKSVEEKVKSLIPMTDQRRGQVDDFLLWFKRNYEIEKPGQKLEDFAVMDETAFLDEVENRRPRSAGKISPAGLRELRETFNQSVSAVRAINSQMETLEHQLSDLVNEAYQLTSAEIELLWRTAPPRMPIQRRSS